jgi:hypothetical protein
MPPNEVDDANAGTVLTNLYGKYWLKDRQWKPPKFNIGDHVRISSERHPFEKAYRGTWKEELFKIMKIKYALPSNMFLLKDLKDRPVAGAFYPAELQKVPFNGVYQVEKVLDERINEKGKKEKLVRWAGYSSDFDTWEPASSIKNLKSTL